jgi:hypothetical protein
VSTSGRGYNYSMTRTVQLVAALGLVAVVVVGTSSATWPPITQAASGKTLHLATGGSMTLRLANRWRWSEPHASSSAVELTPVEYLADPGFREWTIDAQHAGRATIRATGTVECTQCALKARRFSVTVVVGSG